MVFAFLIATCSFLFSLRNAASPSLLETASKFFFVSFAMSFFGPFASVGASPSEAEVSQDTGDASDDDSSEVDVVELVLFDSQLLVELSTSGFSSSNIFCCAWDRL